MYYDTVEVKGETKDLTFAHERFFFPFSWFCQKNTKHSALNLKKSHKNLFLAEVNDQRGRGQGQLIGSDVITIGFPNNPQIHKDV